MISVSLFAIPIALIGNAIVMLGYVLQKRASINFPPIEKTTFKHNIKNFLTSPIWLLGILCTTLSIPAAFYAYSFGSIVLVNSLGGTGLVFLAFFSYHLLGEKLEFKEYIAYSILTFGVIISGIFSSKTVTQESIEEFWNLFINFSSLVFLILLNFLAIAASIIEFHLKLLPNYSGLISTISAGIFMALGMIAMKGWGMFFKNLTFSSLQNFKFWFFAFFNILFSNLATIVSNSGSIFYFK